MRTPGPYSSFFQLLLIFQKSSLIFLDLYCTIWEEEITLFLLVSIHKAFSFFSEEQLNWKKEKLSNNYKVNVHETPNPWHDLCRIRIMYHPHFIPSSSTRRRCTVPLNYGRTLQRDLGTFAPGGKVISWGASGKCWNIISCDTYLYRILC